MGKVYKFIDEYTARRLRIWLRRKAGKGGTGYRQYPDHVLFQATRVPVCSGMTLLFEKLVNAIVDSNLLIDDGIFDQPDSSWIFSQD